MVELIGQLVALDKAYLTDDGVYMDVESVDDYGLLAHQSLDEMRSGGGERDVFGADQKRHPADFVLWKFSKARTSRRGRRRGVTAAPAGTPSAW